MTGELIILCTAAFFAGFIDSIVGGGGLVQTPATLVVLPQYPVATLLGTTKIPAFIGTSMAAFQYAKRVMLQWKLLLWMCSIALLMAMAGSATVARISNSFMKPMIFIILIAVAVYTFAKKDFGSAVSKTISDREQLIYGSIFAVVVGFYDGFIGPGAGSFLLLFFITTLGFDFLKASAHAKFVNLATNMGSILYFSASGHILYKFALPMAAFNFAGSYFGSRLAILKGNKFIRVFFLLVVLGTIIRFGYDIFFR
ncbi:TSUP family transporter [Ferruginibacter sp. HRS2-29]|uniref:sulfite exporter TauE/SafE family protein n=1 Tax=Ferruginibacter sp. HRS2-29 TaxID=2487334 RepID=UPI0020CD8204|nr:TSUP family transporter [Ferruginibacter sp. HRS2-29]MCP9749858.1 sulfite exporter TauE/SafE family protein [Ferruginibacter sp. HRS2-29]